MAPQLSEDAAELEARVAAALSAATAAEPGPLSAEQVGQAGLGGGEVAALL